MQQAILDFWFGAPAIRSTDDTQGMVSKDAGFDASIASRFATPLREAIAGGFETWRAEPRSCLALVLLLDQFTRNVFRGTPQAFSGDARALGLQGCGGSWRRSSTPPRGTMVHVHAVPARRGSKAQQRSVGLFTRLRDDGLPEPLPWAEKHAAVVQRFSRFPHRNPILGRASTPDEEAFLREPGSSF